MMSNYFSIIDESNDQLLKLINKIIINSSQWFPIFAFSKICNEIEKVEELKEQQKTKITSHLGSLNAACQSDHEDIKNILDDKKITRSNKLNAIFWSVYHRKVELNDIENFLIKMDNKTSTLYRRLLCIYDMMMQ